MDWTHALTAFAAFTAPYLPALFARLDQWFQAWLKAKYPQPPEEMPRDPMLPE